MDWNRDRERKAGKAMGIAGSIYSIVFIVIWCAVAAGMGAWFMLILGLPILGFMIFRLAVMLQKGKKKPQDPWEQASRPQDHWDSSVKTNHGKFCPYCSQELKEEFVFCPTCGRRLS